MSTTYEFAGLHRIKINPPRTGETQFRLRLEFRGIERPDAVEFFAEPGELMALMVGLQKLQARHKIPVPSTLRPAGKPSLRVVPPDE